MPDVDRVFPQTYTDIHIRPTQWTDHPDVGSHTHVEFRVEILVDQFITGKGSGRTLGEAMVAVGLDMMGVEADLLALVLDWAREREK